MVKKIILFLTLIPLLMSCSYSVYSNAYPHMKRVQLMALENKSSEYALGDLVLNRLSESFRDDGRLRLVTQQSDCQIEGSILDYSEKIYSYDAANTVQDYIVIVTFSITFTDLKNNQVLYETKSLPVSEIYKVNDNPESTARFNSKEAALDEICSKLFKTIMQNTLETW